MRLQTLRPSPATIIALIALFVALGGTGYAALSKNSVGSKQLKTNSVTSSKIKKHAVTGKKLAKNAVSGAQIAVDTITGRNIKESTLGEVPRAGVAGDAENFDKYVPFGIFTVNTGESKTLVSYGPFSLIGKCFIEGTELWANVVIATTEEHTAFGGNFASSGDAGPATPEAEREIEAPGAASETKPANSSAIHDQFEAQAPSGRAWMGTVESWASKEAEQCRWSGYIVKVS